MQNVKAFVKWTLFICHLAYSPRDTETRSSYYPCYAIGKFIIILLAQPV